MMKSCLRILIFVLFHSNQIFPEFYLKSRDKIKEIKQETVNTIKKINKDLNNSIFFDTKNLKNKPLIMDSFKAAGYKQTNIKSDNRFIQILHNQKSKDKVVIIAPGLNDTFEKLAPFLEIFSNYDVVLVQYPTNNNNKLLNGYNNLTDKELDLLNVLKFIKSKNYNQIIGVGLCYGSFILSRTQCLIQQNNEVGFDKLIFDSCWSNAFEIAIRLNPFKTYCFYKLIKPPIMVFNLIILKIIELINKKVIFKNISIEEYISKIKKCPILFIHGQNDHLIPSRMFNKIISNISTKTIELSTPCGHANSHLKEKEVYKFFAEEFIEERINNHF